MPLILGRAHINRFGHRHHQRSLDAIAEWRTDLPKDPKGHSNLSPIDDYAYHTIEIYRHQFDEFIWTWTTILCMASCSSKSNQYQKKDVKYYVLFYICCLDNMYIYIYIKYHILWNSCIYIYTATIYHNSCITHCTSHEKTDMSGVTCHISQEANITLTYQRLWNLVIPLNLGGIISACPSFGLFLFCLFNTKKAAPSTNNLTKISFHLWHSNLCSRSLIPLTIVLTNDCFKIASFPLVSTSESPSLCLCPFPLLCLAALVATTSYGCRIRAHVRSTFSFTFVEARDVGPLLGNLATPKDFGMARKWHGSANLMQAFNCLPRKREPFSKREFLISASKLKACHCNCWSLVERFWLFWSPSNAAAIKARYSLEKNAQNSSLW